MCIDAGTEIVVEEFLDGEEASYFALIDGETCVALASAQVGSLQHERTSMILGHKCLSVWLKDAHPGHNGSVQRKVAISAGS